MTSSNPIRLTRRGFLAAAAASALTTRSAAAQIILPATDAAGQRPGQPALWPMTVDGRSYDAYIQTPVKEGQDYSYTCEFDASWIVLTALGIEVDLDDQLEIVGHDQRIEPYAVETPTGMVIYGGDIGQFFSGNYRENFLARSTGVAIRKVFDAFDLAVTPVADRAEIEQALRRGDLIWMKATVDFLPWVPATWVAPTGETFQTVLGNDHALVVMGFNDDGVVIRDPLGPTSTNWERPYQYEVDWTTFLGVFEAQSRDALAIGPAE